MRVDDFDFELPDDLIALRPARPRGSARLLVIDGLSRRDAHVRDLPSLLRAGDLLVLNDTRVIPARLMATRAGRGANHAPVRIELMLHLREDSRHWRAFARPAKRLRPNDRLEIARDFEALVVARGEDGDVTLRFDREGEDLEEAIAAAGALPLPPYIESRRTQDADDVRDYQTTFARVAGAVAAPTAGLHFSRDLFAALERRDIRHTTLTLHVGAGTFLPVRAENVRDHVMHPEWGEITDTTATVINETRANGGRIVAVGTTSLRLLETARGPDGTVRPFAGRTSIFITPGARLRAADLLLTNFHLPRSTLVMLVQAFGGVSALRAAYAHAIEKRYRFYSYGDACLITRSQQ